MRLLLSLLLVSIVAAQLPSQLVFTNVPGMGLGGIDYFPAENRFIVSSVPSSGTLYLINDTNAFSVQASNPAEGLSTAGLFISGSSVVGSAYSQRVFSTGSITGVTRSSAIFVWDLLRNIRTAFVDLTFVGDNNVKTVQHLSNVERTGTFVFASDYYGAIYQVNVGALQATELVRDARLFGSSGIVVSSSDNYVLVANRMNGKIFKVTYSPCAVIQEVKLNRDTSTEILAGMKWIPNTGILLITTKNGLLGFTSSDNWASAQLNFDYNSDFSATGDQIAELVFTRGAAWLVHKRISVSETTHVIERVDIEGAPEPYPIVPEKCQSQWFSCRTGVHAIFHFSEQPGTRQQQNNHLRPNDQTINYINM